MGEDQRIPRAPVPQEVSRRIHIGPAGWSYADWEGIVYPKPKPRGFHALPYLAQFFDCVEINSSFYATPNPKHAERWAELVDHKPDFRFLAKLNQRFTHAPVLDPAEHAQEHAAFRDGLQPLFDSGKFKGLLLQFPVQFRATGTNCDRLQRLFDDWHDVPCAVELRHNSWFVPKGIEWLRARRAALLHIDLPAAKDHPPAEFDGTGPMGYLRLHGRNKANWFKAGVGRDARYDYLYKPREIDELTGQVLDMAETYEDVYVITNNHFEGQAIANAIEIQARLEPGNVHAPPSLLERYPRLSSQAQALGQQGLF